MGEILKIRPRGAAPVLALLMAGLLAVAACYPGGPENLDDLDLVATYRSPDADFGGLVTYALLDTVIALTDENGTADPIDPRFDAAILAALERNMDARGFGRVANDADPDVVLAVGTVRSEEWYYWYNYGYWGGYYPPGWCCYYPPSWGSRSFEFGSIVWTLLDMRGYVPSDPDDQPEAIWLGGINGTLENSATATQKRIDDGIDQGFRQSSYVTAAPSTAAATGEVWR